CAGLGDHFLDRLRDAIDQQVGVVGVLVDRPPRYHLTGEIEQYDGDDGRVEVHADGILAGGFELEQRPRLAETRAAQPARLTDEPGVEEAAGDVRDGLAGQARGLGELDPAQLLAAADRIEDDGIVEAADPIEIRTPPNAHTGP